MAKKDEYDHYHDYNRGYYRDADPTLGVLILVGAATVGFLRQYWTVVVPCFVLLVVIPAIVHFATRSKGSLIKPAFLFGMIAATGYFVVWFFIAHPGFLEVVLGLKPY